MINFHQFFIWGGKNSNPLMRILINFFLAAPWLCGQINCANLFLTAVLRSNYFFLQLNFFISEITSIRPQQKASHLPPMASSDKRQNNESHQRRMSRQEWLCLWPLFPSSSSSAFTLHSRSRCLLKRDPHRTSKCNKSTTTTTTTSEEGNMFAANLFLNEMCVCVRNKVYREPWATNDIDNFYSF